MTDKKELDSKKCESRRKFLKTAGKAAIVAPAAGLILNAQSVSAQGIPIPSGLCPPGTIPDGNQCFPNDPV